MTTTSKNNMGDIFVAAIIALIFIGVAAALVWMVQVKPVLYPTVAEASRPARAKAPVDLDATIEAINRGGCTSCHTIPDIPGAVGQVGPNLSRIGVEGATRRQGYTAEEYIRESIKHPTAFTAPTCPTGPCVTGMMPQIILDDAAIEEIVNYLSTLGK